MRTTPLDCVPAPYDETAIQSISIGSLSSRARSAITMTAPRSTPTSSSGSIRVVRLDAPREFGELLVDLLLR